MREFLRRRPSCGRRFVVRLQSKKLVGLERHTERVVHDVGVASLDSKNPRVIPAGVTLEEVPIERESFDVTFECRNCHHKWTETVTKVQKG